MGRVVKAGAAVAGVFLLALGAWMLSSSAPEPEPQVQEPPPTPPKPTVLKATSLTVPEVPRRLVSSPDGSTLAFEAFRMDGIRIRQVEMGAEMSLLDTREVGAEPLFDAKGRLLSLRSSGDSSAAWRDSEPIDGLSGARLAGLSQSEDGASFAVAIDGTLAVWRGGEVTRHASEGRVVLTAMHPDETQVVIAKRDKVLRLFVYDLDAGTEQPLTPPAAGHQTMPAWSTSGVVFFEKEGTQWTVKVGSENGVTLLGENATLPRSSRSAVSPDGAWFAFFTGDQLVLARTDGTESHTITPPGMAGSDPCFVDRPDGWMLAYTAGPTSERNLYFAPLAGVLGAGGWQD